MRTFHIGGTAQVAEQSSLEAAYDATIKIVNRNLVTDSQGRFVVMGRNCEVVLVEGNGRERARDKVPYGARLVADEGGSVKKGQRIAEWDPYRSEEHTSELQSLMRFSSAVFSLNIKTRTA